MSTDRAARLSRPRILCIDDDRNVGATVQAILTEEGYDVSCLVEITDDAMHRAIDELEPDCILLDSASATSYHQSWDAASWIRQRARSVPVIMFSAHSEASREAQANLTDRSREAGFAAVVPKPFTLDELITAVATAVGRSRPFDHVARADARRDASLARSTSA